MEQPVHHRQTAAINVSVADFQQRLDELARQRERGTGTGGVLSRLALVHQTAKAFALDAAQERDKAVGDVTVEELTNPPLFDQYPDDEPVVIWFSYVSPDDYARTDNL